MKTEPIKVNCDLKVCGTPEADAKAKQDLDVPDPEQAVAKAILDKAGMKETTYEKESEQETSETGAVDNCQDSREQEV